MTTISLGGAFRDLFGTENKWITVLCLCVCQLIPLVGPIVFMGYLFERFARQRNGQPVPDFDFNRFVEYLKAGLWPFLTSLVISVIAMPLFFLAFLPVIIAAVADPDAGGVILVAALVSFAFYLAVFALLTVVIYPVMLRSGLAMSFGAGFSKSFILDFIRKVGLSLLLWVILLGVLMIPAVIVGYFALFIGVYIVTGIGQFLIFHIVFQHYDLYREKGGEALAVAEDLLRDKPATPPLPNATGVG